MEHAQPLHRYTHDVAWGYLTRTRCTASVEVSLCSTNGGHVLYSAAIADMAAVPDVAWEAFARLRLP